MNFIFLCFADIFKFDPEYLANEEKYNQIKKGWLSLIARVCTYNKFSMTSFWFTL
jgi:hypothetical protein